MFLSHPSVLQGGAQSATETLMYLPSAIFAASRSIKAHLYAFIFSASALMRLTASSSGNPMFLELTDSAADPDTPSLTHQYCGGVLPRSHFDAYAFKSGCSIHQRYLPQLDASRYDSYAFAFLQRRRFQWLSRDPDLQQPRTTILDDLSVETWCG